MYEQEFIKQIEQATGRISGTGFGFIIGTQTPFTPNPEGQLSESKQPGYIVWKNVRVIDDKGRTGEYRSEKECISGTIEENLQGAIDFINEPLPANLKEHAKTD